MSWLAVVGLAAGGAAMTGAGVFASWVSTSTSTSGVHDAANLALTTTDTNGTSFSSAVSNLLPGDYIYRYADLVNTGGIAQSFTAAISGTGILGATAGGLQVAVDQCSAAWASDGSCAGTTTAVVTVRDVLTAGSVSLGDVAANDTVHLRYKMLLNASAVQNVFQGQSGRMAVTISGTNAVSGNRNRTNG